MTKIAKQHTQQILATTPKSSTTVNKVLAELGIEERLVRGNGYWYFIKGKASAWSSSSVAVYRITAFTVEGWLEQWALLAADYRNDLDFTVEYSSRDRLRILGNTSKDFNRVYESGDAITIVRAILKRMAAKKEETK